MSFDINSINNESLRTYALNWDTSSGDGDGSISKEEASIFIKAAEERFKEDLAAKNEVFYALNVVRWALSALGKNEETLKDDKKEIDSTQLSKKDYQDTDNNAYVYDTYKNGKLSERSVIRNNYRGVMLYNDNGSLKSIEIRNLNNGLLVRTATLNDFEEGFLDVKDWNGNESNVVESTSKPIASYTIPANIGPGYEGHKMPTELSLDDYYRLADFDFQKADSSRLGKIQQ